MIEPTLLVASACTALMSGNSTSSAGTWISPPPPTTASTQPAENPASTSSSRTASVISSPPNPGSVRLADASRASSTKSFLSPLRGRSCRVSVPARGVDDVEQRSARDPSSEVVEQDVSAAFRRRSGGGAVVRSDDHVGQVPEGTARRQRLRPVRVETGGGDRAVAECLEQGVVVDDSPSRHDDQVSMSWHQRELLGPDQLPGLGRQGGGDDHHVARAQQLAKPVVAVPEHDIAVALPARGPSQSLHPHVACERLARQVPTAVPVADDPERLSRELAVHVAVPLAPLLGACPSRCIAAEHQHEH